MTNVLVLIAALAVTLLPMAATAEPPAPQVILDNPSVRVTVVTFTPGAGTGRHHGVEPEVGIVAEGELVLETPTGRTLLRPGTAYWLPGLTPHDVRNERPSGEDVRRVPQALRLTRANMPQIGQFPGADCA